MSYTLRGRTVAYDNIAPGSISGLENHCASGSAPATEVVGGRDNIAPGSAYPTANIADNIVSGTATAARENL